MERRRRLSARTLAPAQNDLVDDLRVGRELRTTLADRLEEGLQRDVELLFYLDIADLPGPVASLQILDLGRVRVEVVVINEHRVSFDLARIGRADTRWIGVHRHDLALHRVRV